MSTSPEGISLTSNDDFSFTLNISIPGHKSTINGEWQMTSNNTIFFSYQQISQYFTHNGTFSNDFVTMVVPTDYGSIMLRRR